MTHPDHYNQGSIEVWDAIVAWGVTYCAGNAIKYLARAGHKGDHVTDLRKAKQYIGREIRRLEDEGLPP